LPLFIGTVDYSFIGEGGLNEFILDVTA